MHNQKSNGGGGGEDGVNGVHGVNGGGHPPHSYATAVTFLKICYYGRQWDWIWCNDT